MGKMMSSLNHRVRCRMHARVMPVCVGDAEQVMRADLDRRRRIVREESCGVVVGHLTRDALVSALSELREPGRLADCQARSQRAGRERYNWSHAERGLLDLYGAIGLGLGTAARAADTG